MKTKQKLSPITVNRAGEVHHFYASSIARWSVSYDLQGLITRMKADGYPFNVYLVPGPESRPYQIDLFTPQVDGLIWLAFYGDDKAAADADARQKAKEADQ